MQNLNCYRRQRIEALADKQWKIGCVPSYLWTCYCSECKWNLMWYTFKFNKLLKWQNHISNNHYTYFSSIWRKGLNSIDLRNFEGLYIKNFLRLYTILLTIQSLLVDENASHCSRISNKMIRRLSAIIKWHS